jgi:hypothetical protein
MPTPKRFVEHCDLATCYHFDRLQNTYCVRGPWGPNTDPVRYCVPLPLIAWHLDSGDYTQVLSMTRWQLGGDYFTGPNCELNTQLFGARRRYLDGPGGIPAYIMDLPDPEDDPQQRQLFYWRTDEVTNGTPLFTRTLDRRCVEPDKDTYADLFRDMHLFHAGSKVNGWEEWSRVPAQTERAPVP